MTITVARRDRGENNFGPGGGQIFYVAISDDPANDDLADARAAVVTAADATVDGIQLFGVQAREVVRNDSVAAWHCFAQYGAGGGFATVPAPSRPSFTGSLTTEKMIRSRSVVSSGGSGGGSAPDRDQLIGLDSEGRAQGTDVLVPVFTVVYSDTFTDTEISTTPGLGAIWASKVGTVNSATFKGYAAGSLLFMGVNAEPNPTGGYTARLEFGYRPNETGLAIGDGMTGVAVDGWDYLDVSAVVDFDGTAEAYINKADFYHVHRLYERASFADLGV
jgi:hypothetical protein